MVARHPMVRVASFTLTDHTNIMNEPKLCYVDMPWAYFTTQDLDKQWGDDWDDAPYEHNAGEPYEYGDHQKKEGLEPWTITKVAIDVWDMKQPCDDYDNSPYSVQAINAGACAWLAQLYTKDPLCIPAGTTLADFRELIHKAGGVVYES